MLGNGGSRKVLRIFFCVLGGLCLFFLIFTSLPSAIAESVLFSSIPERVLSLQTLTLPEPPKSSHLNFLPDTLLSVVEGTALLSEMGPKGTIADIEEHDPDTRISLYIVREGDTLQTIANLFRVSANTIKWANNITGVIRPGDSLLILPISGVKHTVVKGDTIPKIALKYKADPKDISDFNDIAISTELTPGTILVVPEGEIQAPAVPKALPSNYAANPTSRVRGAGGPSLPGYYLRPVSGAKTQGLHGYNGIDFGAPIGTGVKASASGVVIASKVDGSWNGGYGGMVIISHSNGTQTLYGHLSAALVKAGDTVDRGQYIGLSGNTGKSTGPHLHFEIRGAKNPF